MNEDVRLASRFTEQGGALVEALSRIGRAVQPNELRPVTRYEPYDRAEQFSLIAASFLWFDWEPNTQLFHTDPPQKILAIARIIDREIPHEYAVEGERTWRDRLYPRDALVQLANTRNQKPPFLFKEVRESLDNWLRLTGHHPDDTEELTKGGYRAIALMVRMLQQKSGYGTIDSVVDAILSQAEKLRTHEQANTHGISRSNLFKLLKNGEAYLMH